MKIEISFDMINDDDYVSLIEELSKYSPSIIREQKEVTVRLNDSVQNCVEVAVICDDYRHR